MTWQHLCRGSPTTWKGPCCLLVFNGSQLAVHRALLLSSGWRPCWTTLHWPSREAGLHEEGPVGAIGLSGGPAGQKGPGQEAAFLGQEPGEGSLPGPVAFKVFLSCVWGQRAGRPRRTSRQDTLCQEMAAGRSVQVQQRSVLGVCPAEFRPVQRDLCCELLWPPGRARSPILEAQRR